MSTHNLPQELTGRVLVAGAGISGIGSARLLTDLDVQVVIADDQESARARAVDACGATAITVGRAQETLAEYSLVVTSPGWRPDSPLLVDAAKAGLDVVGDVELAYRLDQAGVFGAPRTWLAVTGTNGKTTTTSMLESMMLAGGTRATAVGNIGISVSDALTQTERIDVLVAELSSFQLHWSSQLTPNAGLVLNLAEDHIDWHGSFTDYAMAKMKVLGGSVAVYGADDEHLPALVSSLEIAGRLISFTLGEPAQGQLGVREGRLVDNAFGENLDLASADGINPQGPAGVLDALAAAAIARSQGIEPAAIAEALQTFEVAGHRGQVVATDQGVTYIDNSKATNPHAADTALAGQDSVIWIAGGQLKGADVTELVTAHAGSLKAALLLGLDRELIRAAVEKYAPQARIHVTDSADPEAAMQELVAQAYAFAEPGDAVILAPAAASLDMYTGMSQRGDLFAAAVTGIINADTDRMRP